MKKGLWMSDLFRVGSLFARLGILLSLLAAACVPLTTGSPANRGGPTVQTAASITAPATSRPALSGELTVFAASSLTDAFNEIAAGFQTANPGVKVTFNYGGTPALRTQLEQGARADVLASVNVEQMDLAVKNGLVAAGARNKLTLVVPKDNPARITGQADLGKPGMKLELAQKDVPVGRYTHDAFAKMAANAADFSDRALKNLVSEEPNVKQALATVQLGNADAAIVYSTDVTPDASATVMQIAIPNQFNVVAAHPFANLKDAKQGEVADAFVAYVLSAPGQVTLKKWGFLPPS